MALAPVARLARIDLVCADPDRLADFYVAAFGFCRGPAAERPNEARRLALRLGEQEIALVRPSRIGRPSPPDVPGWDVAFQHFAIVVADMDAATTRLAATGGWSPITRGGPQRLPPATGGVAAFKFQDPEGHPLEFLAFPPDAVPERWRTTAGASHCLGIDHSAISVADTQTSIAFYERLGFRVKGRSLNEGPEQERLDAVANPRVEVTALSVAPAPPHLELLCYLGDFPRAPDAPAFEDIAATRLVLRGDAEPGVTRDPDGHWLVFESSLAPSS